jgi:hypothetical protein
MLTGESISTREKACPSVTLFITNPTLTGLSLIQDLCVGKPAIKRPRISTTEYNHHVILHTYHRVTITFNLRLGKYCKILLESGPVTEVFDLVGHHAALVRFPLILADGTDRLTRNIGN